MTKEISPALWEKFFDNFKKETAARVTIQHFSPEGESTSPTGEAGLRSIAFQKQNGKCSDRLLIKTGSPGAKPVEWEIVEPFQILFRKEKEGGRFNQLEILAEDGTTTLVFHPGIEGSALDTLVERVGDAP